MTTDTLTDAAAPATVAPSQDTAPPATAPVVADAQAVAQATASADNPSAQADSDKAAAQPAAVEYEPFALPEGVVADEEVLGEFKATAKELNLSQENAQKLVDLQTKANLRARTQWAESAKVDKEFGGPALAENLGLAKKALDSFASPELRNLLDTSGLGNHPEIIRAFVRVGKAISEDGRVVSGSKAGAPSDPARRLFPNQA
jgi:hypothetical protein